MENIKYSTLSPDEKPSPELLKEIEEAAKRPIVFDEDCPELTAEQLAKFRRVVDIRREQRFKRM